MNFDEFTKRVEQLGEAFVPWAAILALCGILLAGACALRRIR